MICNSFNLLRVLSSFPCQQSNKNPRHEKSRFRESDFALEMNSIAKQVSSFLKRSSNGVNSKIMESFQLQQFQQWRGIRVQVRNGNLEQALMLMQRKMQSSGMERLIKREQTHHIKNSEKRVLAKKNLERRLRSQDVSRKLKAVLVKKVRGL